MLARAGSGLQGKSDQTVGPMVIQEMTIKTLEGSSPSSDDTIYTTIHHGSESEPRQWPMSISST